MEHFYTTIATTNTAEFKDRGSKFIAFIFPIQHKEDFKEALKNIKEEHPKADHYCFAYRLGLDKNNYRASDAGEPSGTAGKPILGQMDSAGLTNVVIIVVRYFGGTLLGVPGLINAYKTCAALVLQTTPFVQKEVTKSYTIEVDYMQINAVVKIVKQCRGMVLHTNASLFTILTVQIPVVEQAFFTQSLSRITDVTLQELI